jgi:hypothetical protein
MDVSPTAANFVRVHTVHHQPLKVERLVDSALVREEAQFSSLNFKYPGDTDVPVFCYKNKWDENWNHYWFYYTIENEELPLSSPSLRICLRVLARHTKMEIHTVFFSLLSRSW